VINYRVGSLEISGSRLRPVGGATGDCIPHILADLVEVIVDWKFLAAHRAAKYYHASADSKLDLLAAGLAVHELNHS
jgi:hypothetical protein